VYFGIGTFILQKQVQLEEILCIYVQCTLYTQKKIKYFVLKSNIFGVKTSPNKESTEPKNKVQLSSTNFFGLQPRMNNS